MTALTMTNKAAENGIRTGRLKLRERFTRYMEKNGFQIACGLLALNGNFNAYRFYMDQTSER